VLQEQLSSLFQELIPPYAVIPVTFAGFNHSRTGLTMSKAEGRTFGAGKGNVVIDLFAMAAFMAYGFLVIYMRGASLLTERRGSPTPSGHLISRPP